MAESVPSRTLTTAYLDFLNPPEVPESSRLNTRYMLRISEYSGGVTRMPVLFGVPSTTMNQIDPLNRRPQAWGLDLGMLQEFVEIKGVCSDDESLTNPAQGLAFATMTVLQEIARVAGTGLTSTIDNAQFTFAIPPGGVILHLDSGPNQGAESDTWDFKGFVLSFNYNRIMGQMYFDYTMRIGLTYWPLKMHMTSFST